MTTAADDTAVEEAFEAYLAGRPVADAGAGVASFAAAVRATATEPGRPNAALAELLATGLLVDQSAPSPRTAPSRRRRRLAMIFPALLAKLLSAGAVAQAATGAGVAVVIVTSAGAAGVLPDPVQETFSSIVGTETEQTDTVDSAPVEDGTTDEVTDTTDTTDTETDGTETDGETPLDSAATPPTLEEWQQGPDSESDQDFSAWVSEGARLGYVDGETVSRMAHERNERRRNGDLEDDETTTPETGEDVTEAEDGEGDVTVQEDAGDDRRHGNGNGRGNGNGNGNGGGRGNG
jgi:hypothetical protein